MAIQRKLSCAAHFYGVRHMGGWATVVGEWRPHWLQASGAHEPLDAPALANLVQAAIAQLAARRSHNPKVVSSILTRRIPFTPFLVVLTFRARGLACKKGTGI